MLSITDRLRAWALDDPTAPALTVVTASGERAFTAAALWDRVERLAVALAGAVPRGERALLLLDNDEHYVCAFLACLQAGVIAVPAFPPESLRDAHQARLAGMAADCQPAVVLSTAELLERHAQGSFLRELSAAVVRVAVDVWTGDGVAAARGECSLDDIAFLQYTSGSTSAPKGVCVTHRNLLANSQAISDRMSVRDDDVFASWLPLYHDMGLIGGLLQPLYRRLHLVLMSPGYFLERPSRWLEAIARHRATISGGPDFAFRLCTERVRPTQTAGLDLSCWRLAFSGAEPVQRQTLQDFAAQFAPLGFDASALYPCYGLAEATLLVTGVDRGAGAVATAFDAGALARGAGRVATSPMTQDDGTTAWLVNCGIAAPDHEVRVLDTDRRAVPDGGVGEIYVSGPSIAAGYWRRQDASEDTFPVLDGKRWLATGDLGFFHDGQLYIAGRRKDLIIVRGHNIYPQDVERSIERDVAEVRRGRVAAFAVPVQIGIGTGVGANVGSEGIGVAVEIARTTRRRVSAEQIAQAIARSVAELCAEPPAVCVLLEPGALPKTSSGKLQRSACRTGWRDGTLQAYAIFERGICVRNLDATPATDHAFTSAAEGLAPAAGGRALEEHATGLSEGEDQSIARRIALHWSEVLGRPPQSQSHFFVEGGNSLRAVQLAVAIADDLGLAAPPQRLIFEHPTFDALVGALSSARTAESQAGLAASSLTLDEGRSSHASMEQTSCTAAESAIAAETGSRRDTSLPAIDARSHPALNDDFDSPSPAQQRQYLLWQLAPEQTVSHLGGVLQLRGQAAPGLEQRLQHALNACAQRHSALRSRFVMGPQGRPQIHVLRQVQVPLQYVDLRSSRPDEAAAAAHQTVHALFRAPFDLSTPPLIRAAWIALPADRFQLVLVMHHIAGDGPSVQLLLQDLSALLRDEALAPLLSVSAGVEEHDDREPPHPREETPPPLLEVSASLGDPRDRGRSLIPHTDRDLDRNLDRALTRNLDRASARDLDLDRARARDLAYWLARLAPDDDGAQPLTQLPTDRPRPVTALALRAASQPVALPAALLPSLQAAAIERNTTLAGLLLTAWLAVLHRRLARSEVRIGVPVTGRWQRTMQSVVGLFVNTVVLRSDAARDLSLDALTRQTRDAMLDAQQHGALPFDALVEALRPERQLGVNPLVQLSFNHLEEDLRALERATELSLDRIDVLQHEVLYDVTLETRLQHRQAGSVLTAWLVYAADLFDAPTMAVLADQWREAVMQLVSAPESRVHALALDGPQALAAWHPCAIGTGSPTGAGQRMDQFTPLAVHEQFTAVARRWPDAVALASDRLMLTYAALDTRADHLAEALLALGVRREDRVGLLLPRGPDAIVAMLAVLKSGAAYVPLDPAYPADRLRQMCEDAQCACLVVTDEASDPGIAPAVPRLHLGDVGLMLAATSVIASATEQKPAATSCHPDQLVYLIFTSGSTGRPKAVAVSHGALSMHMAAIAPVYGLDRAHRELMFFSLSFDAAIEQWLGPLLHGGCLVFGDATSTALDPADVAALVKRHRINTLHLPPAYLRVVAPLLAPGSLRTVIVGGEALAADDLTAALALCQDGGRVVNAYGPTETVITPTAWIARQAAGHDLQRSDGTSDRHAASAPIGRPIGDRRAHVLDADLHPAPLGAVGELWIGGTGLARGYAGRPSATAERFIADPSDDGGRLYRTGDLVRWRHDAQGEWQLEYLGRADQQVKVRGFRIELGELESALRSLPAVTDACAWADGHRLVAWAAAPVGTDAQQLRHALRDRLPQHLLPAQLQVLPTLPVTPNGKIDRAALRAMAADATSQHKGLHVDADAGTAGGNRIDSSVHSGAGTGTANGTGTATGKGTVTGASSGSNTHVDIGAGSEPALNTSADTNRDHASGLTESDASHSSAAYDSNADRSTALLTTLSELCARLLKLPSVAPHENFFDLGGHSLLLIELHQHLVHRPEPGFADLKLVDLFRFPTVASLAAHLQALAAGPAAPDDRPSARAARQRQHLTSRAAARSRA